MSEEVRFYGMEVVDRFEFGKLKADVSDEGRILVLRPHCVAVMDLADWSTETIVGSNRERRIGMTA